MGRLQEVTRKEVHTGEFYVNSLELYVMLSNCLTD